MFNRLKNKSEIGKKTSRLRRLFPRLVRSDDGAAALEFALLALPYFMIIFAIFETFIAFTGEQIVGGAVDTLARRLRTGQITATDTTKTTYLSESQFRQAFCDEIAILMKCSGTEVATPAKLFIDVQSAASFADITTTIGSDAKTGDVDTSTFAYAPGGPGTINMVRAVYKWEVMLDLMRPYFSTVKIASDPSKSYFLIMETTAYKNEPFPE